MCLASFKLAYITLAKIVVTFEPIMQFGCPSRFRIYKKDRGWSKL